jgi:NadR type nicotinamide-nucleotide adenylyltransferase
MSALKKIVLIGPESTGKSVLCEKLAQHYHSVWCPEYAREYLIVLDHKYTYDDLLVIAKNQAQLAKEYTDDAVAKKLSTIFFDTDMYVMKVWCEVVFGKCHQWIIDQTKQQQNDLYLLCKPDIPWIKDDLREYPDLKMRERLYAIYKEMLNNQSAPWVEISGNYDKRFEKAIQAVDKILK